MVTWESLWFYLKKKKKRIFIGINQLRVDNRYFLLSMIALNVLKSRQTCWHCSMTKRSIHWKTSEGLQSLSEITHEAARALKSTAKIVLRPWLKCVFWFEFNLKFFDFCLRGCFCRIFNCVGKKHVSLRAQWKWWCCTGIWSCQWTR